MASDAKMWWLDMQYVDEDKLFEEHLRHRDGRNETHASQGEEICGHCHEAFTTEPWKFSRNDIETYFSIRYEKREELFQNMTEDDRRKVRKETVRIQEARDKFDQFSPKKKLVGDLRNFMAQWKTARQEQVLVEQHTHTWQQRLDKWRPKIKSKEDNQGQPPSCSAKAKDDNKPPVQFFGPRVSSASGQSIKPPDDDKFGDHYKVGVMYFKKPKEGSTFKGSKCGKLKGEFPDQKIAVDDALSGDTDLLKRNPLAEKCPEDTIRYFHIPSNNMQWVEVAMARYYGQEPRTHDDMKPVTEMTKAEKLLCREFWRGQVHGSACKGPVHARHMRPRCSIISCPQGGAEPVPSDKNVALFLPYLHWELYARQVKMQRAVDDTNKQFGTPKKQKAADVVATMRERVALQKIKSSWTFKKDSNQPSCKSIKRRKIVANILWTVAQIADEMTFEADERLLRAHLHNNPPLHIRRTLDQYYFMTLDGTSIRDKEQVVHRGTRGGKNPHTRNISTRIVMVDQLWLWILDGNTIVTSFPRRWGRNKPDSSGVHKSLRVRLDAMKAEGVKSIYHLALIIIDQCSRVFFDRTKSLDLRPEVMDLFGSAIGNVTEFTSIAYESFWRNTSLIAEGVSLDVSGSKPQRCLDINPEGRLLMEAQDIAEELMIMLRIYNQQLTVVKDFRRYLVGLKDQLTRQKLGRDSVEDGVVHKLDALLQQHLHQESTKRALSSAAEIKAQEADPAIASASITIQEADIEVEMIENRRSEIQELEDTAMRTCQQLEGLLSLKQQQASILEAKAAIERADESVKQGRSIMAFTVVTIFFLPLGFFAAFFGMNNLEATNDAWMTLNEQLTYMFSISATVIVIAISLAFSTRARAALNFVLLPLALIVEYTGLASLWRQLIPNSEALNKENNRIYDRIYHRREKRKLEAKSGVGSGEEGVVAGERQKKGRRIVQALPLTNGVAVHDKLADVRSRFREWRGIGNTSTEVSLA